MPRGYTNMPASKSADTAITLKEPKTKVITSITSFCQSIGLPYNAVLEIMQSASNDGDRSAQQFMTSTKHWMEVNPDMATNLDNLCKLAKIKQATAIGLIVQYVSSYQQGIANLKAALALNDVVDVAIESSKQLNSNIGLEDRKILLKQQKFIIDEKAPLVQINNNNTLPVAATFESIIKGNNNIVEGEIIDESTNKDDNPRVD